ncbi:MAG TPA: hypothetical protein VGB55_09610 [Tepidisphaeraceae bacterium]|jgi:hypothetical protein
MKHQFNVLHGRSQTADKQNVHPAPASASWSTVAPALLLVALAACGRAAYLSQTVGSDTAMFVYMGKLVDSGGRLGVDLVDNKLPSVGLLMSVPYRLFEANWSAYTLLGLAMTLIATFMLARAAGRCIGPAATWPVAVGAAVWLNFPLAVFGLLQLETIQVFFVALAACAIMEFLCGRDWRDALLAGLCAGVAVWAKPTAAAVLPAAVAAIAFGVNWSWRQRALGVLWISLGAVVPIALCALLLVKTGMADALPETLHQLRDYAANSTADWGDLAKPVVVIIALAFPILILGWVFRRAGPDGGASRAIILFVIAWLLMELIGVVAQRRMYGYHFLVLGPPAALLAGLVARRPRAVPLLAAYGPIIVLSLLWAGGMLFLPDRHLRMTAVINRLEKYASPGDRVWIDDYPRLMTETHFVPGSRVPLTFLFANSDAAPAHFGGQILRDFEQSRPQWIVLPHDVEEFTKRYGQEMAELAAYPQRAMAFAHAWRRIDDYARANYTVVETVQGLDVMVRRPDPAGEDVAISPRD